MATSTTSSAPMPLSELLANDWKLQHSDNPCFASQSGNHAFDAQLQDISPAAFEWRLEHNRGILEAMACAAELARAQHDDGEATELGLSEGGVVGDVHAEPSMVASTGGGGGRGGGSGGAESAATGLSAADFAMLRKSVADETRALELGCHLMPVNSIG